MEEEQQEEILEDPFLNIFEEGIDAFLNYTREKGEGYRTKTQRHKDKEIKIRREINDPEYRKQRNILRRKAEQAKLVAHLSTMTPQQKVKYLQQGRAKRKQKREKVKKAIQTGQVFMVDLVFEDRMCSKQNKSLSKQLELIVKAIKHIDNPPSIHLCSVGGQLQVQLLKMGYQYWSITSHSVNVVEAGQKLGKKLVYLSPDAQQPLETVEQDTAYILGGLIDRSIIKNASLYRAKGLDIEAKRLPIRQFMRNRAVLNLDHVVMMVLKYREVGNWKEAFDYAAPKRWKKDEEKQEGQGSDKEEKEEISVKVDVLQ